MCLVPSLYYVLPIRDAERNGGLGILFRVLSAVGGILRNELVLCTPFIRKVHQDEMRLSIQSPSCLFLSPRGSQELLCL